MQTAAIEITVKANNENRAIRVTSKQMVMQKTGSVLFGLMVGWALKPNQGVQT
jgi:hypothetical protein